MTRISRRTALLSAACVIGGTRSALAVDEPAEDPPLTAIAFGKLWRPHQPLLENGVITLANGTIRSIGSGAPASGEGVLDARDKLVTAGFTDLLTSVGLIEIGLEPSSRDDRHATSDPVRAAFLAADGYNPASSLIPVTRAAGITSVGVVPHGGLIGGQSAWADLDGDTPDAALASRRLALHVFLDDPWHGGRAASLGTSLLRLRELFEDARLLARNAAQFERRQLRDLSASRLDLLALRDALEGRIPVVFHVDRKSDILNVLAFGQQHKLRLLIASGAEAWRAARELAAAKVPVIVYPLDNLPYAFSALGARADNAALLAKAGATVIVSSGETHNARKLRQVAGNAVRAGLSRDQALAAVTLEPARAVGLGARYGAIEPGRLANLVVWSGDPFELSTKVEAVVIRGRRVSLRTRQTVLFERYRGSALKGKR